MTGGPGVLKAAAALLVSLLILFKLIKGEESISWRRCGWDVTAQNSCPDNQESIWQCLADLKNCSGLLKYHCAKDSVTKKFVEACGHSRICEEGLEPLITFSDGNMAGIYCEQCSDSERYNPIKNTSSDSFSECPEVKNICHSEQGKEVCEDPQGLDGHMKNRKCRCRMQDFYIIEVPDALPGDDCTSYSLRCYYAGPCPTIGVRNQTLFFNENSGKHECRNVCLDDETSTNDNCVRLSNPTTTSTAKSTLPTTTVSTSTTEKSEELSDEAKVGISVSVIAFVVILAVVGGCKLYGNNRRFRKVVQFICCKRWCEKKCPGTFQIWRESEFSSVLDLSEDDVKNVFKGCRVKVIYELKGKDVIDAFQDMEMFKSYDKKIYFKDLMEEIKSSDRNRKLIDMVSQDPGLYKAFKECLAKSSHKRVLKILKKEEENIRKGTNGIEDTEQEQEHQQDASNQTSTNEEVVMLELAEGGPDDLLNPQGMSQHETSEV